MKKHQSGFTLIELVAVIVLLGILAVTALPRFIDLQGDARESVLNGTRSAMSGSAQQIYALALMRQSTGATGTVATDYGTVDLVNGYPKAVSAANVDILGVVQVDDDLATQDDGANNRVYVGYDLDGDGSVNDDNCYVLYTDAASAAAGPTISIPDPNDC